jgi:hypothetical protein
MSDLAGLLEPMSRFVSELDLSDAPDAERRLRERFPADCEEVRAVREAAFRALEAGAICERGEPGMTWGRISKPDQTPGGCSVDAVHMSSSSGPVHSHPKGEVSLCLHEDDTATFEGRHDTWVVLPAGSRHVPTVEAGSMLIFYWLPEGAVTWG